MPLKDSADKLTKGFTTGLGAAAKQIVDVRRNTNGDRFHAAVWTFRTTTTLSAHFNLRAQADTATSFDSFSRLFHSSTSVFSEASV